MSRQVQGRVGYTFWIYFAIAGITVLFFLLANVNTDAEFKSVLIFSIVTITSFVILLLLMILPKEGGDDVKKFFMQEITLRKTIYIPLGLAGVFLISILTINSNVEGAAFLSIFGSGLVMGFCLLRTHTIVVPILIHGAYNSIVVVIRDQFPNSILSSTPIPVPEIEISLGGVSSLASQVLFQNFLTATSEEMFKILIIAFFVVTLRNKFVGSGGTIVIGMIVATLVWASFHFIQSLR